VSEAWGKVFRRIQEYPTLNEPMRLDLPSMHPHPTVTLTREQVMRFRSDWAVLHAALCVLLEVEPEDLSPFHLMVAVGRKTGMLP